MNAPTPVVLADKIQDAEFIHAPCDRIRQGKNPRTYFDPVEMKQLEDSFRSTGRLIQPIVVRPVTNDPNADYELVAGERRWRGWKTIFGADALIACLAIVMSDEEAETIATVENIQRSNMSVTEEAEAANRLLIRLRDRDEVAFTLGWPRSILDRRLALMRCIPEVRTALTERTIKLGHAELLAVVPEANQLAVFSRVVELQMSVEMLKKALTDITQKLDSAVFDQTECASCPHNSSLQSGLFAENVGEGNCTHPTCFQKKTTTRINEIRDELAQSVQRVEILGTSDAEMISPIKLLTTGSKAINKDQFEACRGCANYGATLSTSVGSVGVVERDICFDLTCHTLKQAEHLKSKSAPAAILAPKSAGGSPSQKSASAPVSTGMTAHTTVTAKPGAIRQAIKDYAEKVWRATAYKVIYNNPELATSFLLWIGLTGNARLVDGSKLRESFEKLSGKKISPTTAPNSGIPTIQALTGQQSDKMLTVLAGTTLGQLEINHVKSLLALNKVDMSQYWTVNQAFFELLTLGEIQSFCAEVGLAEVITEPELKKVLSGKKSIIIDNLMAHQTGAFAGKVPASLDYTK